MSFIREQQSAVADGATEVEILDDVVSTRATIPGTIAGTSHAEVIDGVVVSNASVGICREQYEPICQELISVADPSTGSIDAAALTGITGITTENLKAVLMVARHDWLRECEAHAVSPKLIPRMEVSDPAVLAMVAATGITKRGQRVMLKDDLLQSISDAVHKPFEAVMLRNGISFNPGSHGCDMHQEAQNAEKIIQALGGTCLHHWTYNAPSA